MRLWRAMTRPASRSLLVQVFIANASLLGLGVLVLVFTPLTVSDPISAEQATFLLIGFVVLSIGNVILLRRSLAPLRQLTRLMAEIDPRTRDRLGAVPRRDSDVAALTEAFEAMLGRLERERLSARRSTLAAQEEERRRIARELHDEIGQTLTAIALEAERSAESGETSARVRDWADRALADLRRIGRELRPEALDDLGLVNALIALCTRVSEQSGLEIERNFEGHAPEHEPDLDLVVYRVAQESLTNVVRHARARRAVVSFWSDHDGMHLCVADDGVGISELPPGSAGVAGMRERAALVGAHLDVRTRSGSPGTEVLLDVPIEHGRP